LAETLPAAKPCQGFVGILGGVDPQELLKPLFSLSNFEE
jgi:hypothetical protein